MIDTYLFEIFESRKKYILEHKDQSSQNLKKFYNPDLYKKSYFEIYEPKISLGITASDIEKSIRGLNEMFGVCWSLNDTSSEMKKLKDSGNAFLMYVADFCQLAAEHLIKGEEYSYSDAFFFDLRSTEFALFQIQDIFDVQVTLKIIIRLWCGYANYIDSH